MKMGSGFEAIVSDREIKLLAMHFEKLYHRVRRFTESEMLTWMVVQELLFLNDRRTR